MALCWPVICVLSLVTVITHAELDTDGTGREKCGRKFCKSDCVCRVVDKNGKWFVKECVKKSSLDERAKARTCGHSGYPVLSLLTRVRGQRRWMVARAIRGKKNCPPDRFVFFNRTCCSDTDKKGQCPFFLETDDVCDFACGADNDCLHNLKCCSTTCGAGKVCLEPLPETTCDDKFCVPNYECRNTGRGARCCLKKRGVCPPQTSVFCKSDSRHKDCRRCESDESCPSIKKCCPCNDCVLCLRPPKESLSDLGACLHVPCGDGLACMLDKGTCITAPCVTVTTCRPPGSRPGQCPTVDDQEVSACKWQECTRDEDCTKPLMKCCPSSCGDGSKRCVRAVPLTSCLDVTCPANQTCYEVFSQEHQAVSPMCLKKAPLPSEVCGPGKNPLLLLVTAQDLEVLNCGSALNKVPCPDGYTCTGQPGPFPICCPDKPPCHPPCQESQNCEPASEQNCDNPPCVSTKCVTQNVCALPKISDDGKCKNQFHQTQKYYFDDNQQKCQKFYYFCGGNANNFDKIEECRKKCESNKSFAEVCPLPRKVGDCWHHHNVANVYYFDFNSLRCQTMPDFHCGFYSQDINANNFKTHQDCSSLCEGRWACPPVPHGATCEREVVDKCRLNRDEGKVCRDGQSCCMTACGRRCMAPAPL